MLARTVLSTVRRSLATVAATPAAATAIGHAADIHTTRPPAPLDTTPSPPKSASDVPTVIVPVYQPPTVQALIRDFVSHKPAFIAQLPHSIYAAPVRKDILHRCVIWQRDAQRQGTHAVKGRADVRGTTRKFAPQKGRGAARVGSRRVPLYRGGGVAHGPVPRSHATELQAKVRELGMRSALAVKYTTDELVLTTPITVQSIADGKTKSLAAILNKHYPPRTAAGVTLAEKNAHRKYSSVLIVAGIEESPATLDRAASNLPDVKVLPASDINVYDVLRHEYLVLDHAARKFLEWRLKPSLGDMVSRRR